MKALLVPPGVVTVTETEPVPGGLVAEIIMLLSTVKLSAGTPPKLTAVASFSSKPLIPTVAPPVSGPVLGSRATMEGGTT